MVLKKPYAFLIKHFKLIHIILCLPLLYLIIKTRNIVNFFNVFIKNNYTVSEINIASNYISYLIYIAIIGIVLLSLAIYFLMKQKEKSTKFYMFIMIFYIILLIVITFYYNAFTLIETETLAAKSARLYRDISYLVYIPQYFFIFFTVQRAIGFNLKKFNFEADIKELEIEDIDSEEFELNLGDNSYKYKRGLRRLIREIKYYLIENKSTFFFFIIFLVVLVGTIIYFNYGIYHQNFKQLQSFNHNGLLVQVVDSELSNLDVGGRKIDGKYYLAVSLKIENRSKNSTRLDYENFKIMADDESIMPVLDKGSFFIDLGIPYTRDTTIDSGVTNTYVICYEIPENKVNKNIKLRILESIAQTNLGITPVYKEVNLNYEKILKNNDEKVVNFGKILELSDTRLGATEIQLKSYSITKSYTYNYEKCSSLMCQNLQETIGVDPVKYGANKTLLAIERNFKIDSNSSYYKARKGTNNFIKDFVQVRYTRNNNTKETTVTNITPNQLKDYWILIVPSEIESAEKIDLLVNIRGKIYVMNLRE